MKVKACLTLLIAVFVSVPRMVCGADTMGAASKLHSYFLQPHDVVLFLGNSITQAGQSEVDFLTEDLKKQYPELADGPDKVTFVLAGIGGEQAFNGYKRLKDLIAQHKPTVCVVGYGTCEVIFKNEKSFTPAMKDIIKELKAAKVAVTIVSAPPISTKNWHQTYPAEQFTKGLPGVVGQARRLAEQEQVPFVDTYEALKAFLTKSSQEWTVDGIHPNPIGYRQMADALQQAWGFGKPLAKTGSPRN